MPTFVEMIVVVLVREVEGVNMIVRVIAISHDSCPRSERVILR
jgi:hypothetical protein